MLPLRHGLALCLTHGTITGSMSLPVALLESSGCVPDIDKTRRLTSLASRRVTMARRSATDLARLSILVTTKTRSFTHVVEDDV
jgi:hypothetical protein